MTRDEFIEELADILQADPDDLLPATELQTLAGWDSVGVLGVTALFDKVGRPIDDVSQLLSCSTVEDLIALAGEKLHP